VSGDNGFAALRIAVRRIRQILFCAMFAVLSGCGGHLKDVLTPVADTSPE
jgi:hypothetical protein